MLVVHKSLRLTLNLTLPTRCELQLCPISEDVPFRPDISLAQSCHPSLSNAARMLSDELPMASNVVTGVRVDRLS